MLYPIIPIFGLISVIKRGARDLPIHGYSLATTVLFIVWPERQGLRFLYPVLPFLFMLLRLAREEIANSKFKSLFDLVKNPRRSRREEITRRCDSTG